MSRKNKSRKGKFRSLTVTIALSFLFLSLIVLSISSVIHIYFSIQAQQISLENEQKVIVHESATLVQSFLYEKINKLESGSGLSDFVSKDNEEKKILLDRLLASDLSFRQILFLSDDGDSMLRVGRLSSYTTDELIENLESGFISGYGEEGEYISEVYIDEATAEPLVVISIPVEDVFGDQKGELIAEVNLKFMWDLVSGLKVGESGVAYVIDRDDGTLIAFEDVSRVLKRENLEYLDEVRGIVSKDISLHDHSVMISKGIYGTYVVTSHECLESPDWSVVVETPVFEAYKEIITQTIFSLVLFIFSLILATTLGIFLSKKITKPIVVLRNAANKIGEGKLNTRIEVGGSNEIGDLAETFNKMNEDLKKSRKKLEDYSLNLERKVRARTSELERKNKKLKELDEMKINFMNMVTHELKTPLTAIMAYLDILDDAKKSLTPKERKELETIRRNANQLGGLIGNILEVARIESGKFELIFSEVNLKKKINEIVRNLTIIAKNKGLKLSAKIGDVPKTITTDEQRFEEIFNNLISNAIKFTDKGGITIEAQRKGDVVEFAVVDTGVGISEKNARRLFHDFYQVDSSVSRKYGGTGLGLSITKKIVELQGGKIVVKSKVGRGSKFIFTLPIKQKEKKNETKK